MMRSSDWPSASSSLDGQDLDAVLVREAALAHGVLELHAEDPARPDAAFRGKRAAEHGPARLQWMASEKVFRRAHRRHGAFLVELAVGPGAQVELPPVPLHLVVSPGIARHRLRAELLGERHADRLGLAVGVVGAHRHAQAGRRLDQHEFHFPAGVRTGYLDAVLVREQIRGHPVEDRRGLGRLHADLLELADVLAQRRLVAPGPAGNDELGYVHYATFSSEASGTS